MEFAISGIKETTSKLSDLAKRQVPYASMVALNNTAAEIKKAEQQEMRTVFDKPTPYTLNSIGVVSATKKDLVARVFIKDSDRLGERHHLYAEVMGGGRTFKRFERVLRNAGILPQGMYVVPAKEAWLNNYGNIPQSEIVQILSSVKAFGETGYLMNRTGRSRSKTANRYFVMRKAGRPIGIWERLGPGNAKAVMIFVSGASYRKRFDFYKVAEHAAYKHLNRNFRKALQHAISTAR